MHNLKQLRHALALDQHRNYQRAAEALHITQPALTRSIQSLERLVGSKLFDRGPRDVEPTELGALLLQHARALDLADRDLQRELAMAKGLESGNLNVGIGPYAAAAVVGPPMGRLVEKHPGLRTHLVLAPWEELPARVRSREVDLIVADTRSLEEQQDMESIRLQDHPAFLVCRRGHPLAELVSPAWKDVFQYPLVGPRIPERDLAVVRQHVPAQHLRSAAGRGPIAVHCDGSPILKEIVEHSNAVCLMSVFMVIEELRAGRLVIVPGVDFGVRSTLCIAYLRRRTLSKPAQRFVELLLEHDAELVVRERALLRDLAERGRSPRSGNRR